MIKVTGKLDVLSRVAGMHARDWMQREVERISQDPLRKPEIIEETRKCGTRIVQMIDHGQVDMMKESDVNRVSREVLEFQGRWARDPIGGSE